MKLLITTLTFMFISFKSFGIEMKTYPIETVKQDLCHEAFVKGKHISYDPSQSVYTIKWNGQFYNFMAGFTFDSFVISNCRRF